MILLLETVHEDAVDVLRAVDDVELVPDLASFDPAAVRGVRAVVTRGRGQVTAEVMAAMPDLIVVARCGAGLDNVDTAAARAANVAVVHAPGLTTGAVAEHALMLMLAVARRLPFVDAAVKAGDWSVREGFSGTELAGRRLGVVGFGAIGRRIAALGMALGMKVVYSTRDGNPAVAPMSESDRDAAPTHVGIDELLRSADAIQICVPLTDATRSMFGAAQFAAMKREAILINTARGPVVDHGALGEALAAGELAGYGADVWDPEPPGVDDVALSHPATVVTPHVAGLTDVTYRAICVGPAKAVAQILRGQVPDPAFVFG